MASGYVIVDIEVNDPERYAKYIALAPPTIAAFGGRYLARGGRTEVLEGTWNPRRTVILEFESFERAKEWWSSDRYREAKALRQSCSVGNMILVEGV
jgi:uncharacterized protein (DUF1330 family)